ncbi:DUF2345 domain-containing protein [Gilliamella sp. B3000]|nr:DUF2345 domain-containing protein [Gilliamella sp. B2887]MCX8697915.1 DUF2345 domain-containing protein [Gilliamella sp. B3000]
MRDFNLCTGKQNLISPVGIEGSDSTFANQGDINLQAQNAQVNLVTKQDIKISSKSIELWTADHIYIKSNTM